MAWDAIVDLSNQRTKYRTLHPIGTHNTSAPRPIGTHNTPIPHPIGTHNTPTSSYGDPELESLFTDRLL
jgi:hypothetical protein